MGREQKKYRKLCSKICQTEWKAIFLIKVNESLTHVNNDKIFVKEKHFFLLPRVLRDKYGGVFVSSWNVPRNETSFPDIYFFPAVCYILLGRLMISDEILFALKENAVKQFWNGDSLISFKFNSSHSFDLSGEKFKMRWNIELNNRKNWSIWLLFKCPWANPLIFHCWDLQKSTKNKLDENKWSRDDIVYDFRVNSR